MKLFKEFVENKDINSFFSHLFMVRDQSHKLHLSTKSYAQHKALDGFYEGILALIDELVETYQGQYDLVKLDFSSSEKTDDPEKLIREFSGFISDSRKLFSNETYLQNILDEMAALTYRTLYKLRFLK